jgi:SAM-dependent methyltransferase
LGWTVGCSVGSPSPKSGTCPVRIRRERYPELNSLAWMLWIAAAIFGTFMLWTTAVGAAWEPTSRNRVRKMLEMAGVGPSDVVYDLGSGDGRVVAEAAKAFHARAVGVEADPVRVLYSRVVVSLLHLRNRVKIVWGNFFHIDLSEATIVTLFLTQRTNRKLASKLRSELKSGAKVISYVWTFDDWAPVSTDTENELTLYVVQ